MSKELPVLTPERMTIDCAREIKTLFLEALEKSGGASIDFEQIQAIDLAGIQLVLAFFREALQKGLVVRCTGTIPEHVIAKFKLFGFCDESCDSSEKLCEALSSFFDR